MQDQKDFKEAYSKLLLENTSLHAQKNEIMSRAVASITKADMEIAKLQNICGGLLERAVNILRVNFMPSAQRDITETEIMNLAPMRISAEGKQE